MAARLLQDTALGQYHASHGVKIHRNSSSSIFILRRAQLLGTTTLSIFVRADHKVWVRCTKRAKAVKSHYWVPSRGVCAWGFTKSKDDVGYLVLAYMNFCSCVIIY